MKKELKDILLKLDLNPLAQKEDLEALIKKTDFNLDKDYLDFLQEYDGASGNLSENSYILLWKTKEVLDLNPYYEDMEECKELLFFGSDGGNTGYAFNKGNSKIIKIDFLDISFSEPTDISDSFIGFLIELTNAGL